MDEDELLKKHKLYLGEGYVLLSLTKHNGHSDEHRYWATWVNHGNERDILRLMKRYGLTQAEIKAN